MGEPLIDPVIEYRNARGHGEGTGICVIGGRMYRGEAIEGLRGHYVFGDWTQRQQEAAGVVFVARPPEDTDAGENRLWPREVAIELDDYVLGFGQDAEGELYVMTTANRGPAGATGRVWRIVGSRKEGPPSMQQCRERLGRCMMNRMRLFSCLRAILIVVAASGGSTLGGLIDPGSAARFQPVRF
jgi:hypothetical protein